MAFDTSGLYLAVGGTDARVYGAKQEWEVVKTFPDQPKKVRCHKLCSQLSRRFHTLESFRPGQASYGHRYCRMAQLRHRGATARQSPVSVKP